MVGTYLRVMLFNAKATTLIYETVSKRRLNSHIPQLLIPSKVKAFHITALYCRIK